MTGATEPRPPTDPDFEADAALDEAEEASPSLELDLDETPAEPGPLARGAAVDQGVLAACAARPRRLSHDRRRRRGALCRQGALDQEAHPRLHDAGAAIDPHRPHGRADGLDGVRHDRDRGRGAAARNQSHQAAEAALQRAAARRQELSLYPHHRRPRAPQLASIAARARSRATISARSPAPAR